MWDVPSVNHWAEVHTSSDEIAGNGAQVITGRRTQVPGGRPESNG